MPTTLTVHMNTSNQDFPLLTSGVEWTQVDLAGDSLIISGGNPTVADGQPIPGQTALVQAAPVRNGSQFIYDKYFLADFNVNQLKQVFLMGDLNSRYVMAFDFNGLTASEPVLEFWDDINLNTADNKVLGGDDTAGSGVPTSSFIRGITTTNASSGAPGWAGKRLAGASDGHFLFLNDQNGALTAAKTLYANLKVILPASPIVSLSNTPVMAIKFTTN